MIDALTVWRTVLAFTLTISGTYMVFIAKGLRRQKSEFAEEVSVFSIAGLIGGFTFFLEVVASL